MVTNKDKCIICDGKEWNYDVIVGGIKFCGDCWFDFSHKFIDLASDKQRKRRNNGKPMSRVLFHRVVRAVREDKARTQVA